MHRYNWKIIADLRLSVREIYDFFDRYRKNHKC